MEIFRNKGKRNQKINIPSYLNIRQTEIEDFENPFTEAELRLICKLNAGLVKSVAYKFRTNVEYAKCDLDDLESAGTFGLIKAAYKYDVNNKNGASFFTYAYY